MSQTISHIPSEVCLYGVQSGASCGYCKCDTSSISYGMVSSKLCVCDYEGLMLRGFRRSGTYFYKPVMHETCCPQYPIRLNVGNFMPSKSQKKLIRKYGIKYDNNITIETVFPTNTPEIFDLYKQYQIVIHGSDPEEVTPASFETFLVTSPLHSDRTLNGGFHQNGTCHQLYRLSGILIAVGVIDILPSGLSSVYCFYDPNLRGMELGKYTAIKEIEFCKQHSLPYYYMGFYIHNCEKMKYKAEYKPSELCCPVSFEWFPIDHCTRLIDLHKYTPFHPALVHAFEEMNECDEGKMSSDHAGATQDQSPAPVVQEREGQMVGTPMSLNNTLTFRLFNIYQSLITDSSSSASVLSHQRNINSELLNCIPLYIGFTKTYHYNDMNKNAQKILKSILEEWCFLCGKRELCERITIILTSQKK